MPVRLCACTKKQDYQSNDLLIGCSCESWISLRTYCDYKCDYSHLRNRRDIKFNVLWKDGARIVIPALLRSSCCEAACLMTRCSRIAVIILGSFRKVLSPLQLEVLEVT